MAEAFHSLTIALLHFSVVLEISLGIVSIESRLARGQVKSELVGCVLNTTEIFLSKWVKSPALSKSIAIGDSLPQGSTRLAGKPCE